MAPFALYGLGAIGAAAAGWWRYHTIKPGDLLKVRNEILPATLKVTSIQQVGLFPSANDVIKGTAVGVINGIEQDLKVPLQVRRGDVLQNLSPRFF